MRAISGLPALVRRYSTSVTLSSKFATGVYEGVTLSPAAKPTKDTLFIKSRRPKGFILTSWVSRIVSHYSSINQFRSYRLSDFTDVARQACSRARRRGFEFRARTTSVQPAQSARPASAGVRVVDSGTLPLYGQRQPA